MTFLELEPSLVSKVSKLDTLTTGSWSDRMKESSSDIGARICKGSKFIDLINGN